jgi:peptide/nickel transport system substrate-binding protein
MSNKKNVHNEPQQTNLEASKLPLSRRQFIQTTGALGLAAVAGSMSEVVYAAGKKVLKVRSYADLRSLDPVYSQGIVDEEIHSCIYSKLIQYKPGREWGYTLDAAESVKQKSPTEIAFKLKKGVMFTNGYGEMTAEDVKYSFERVIDESLKSTNKPDWGTLKEVKVTGKYTGTIIFSEPFPPAWNIALPYVVGNIISKKAWEKSGGKVSTTTPCASGPYKFKKWEPKQKSILVRNPNWYGGRAEFDEIHILPIDDEGTAQIAFESGDLDYTRVALSAVGKLKSSPLKNTTLDEYPSLYYVWVGMNVENKLLKNENLRKAIQHAIDVPSIMQASYFGAAKPSTGMIAPGLIGHRDKSIVPPKANFAKAKKYLAAAGFKDDIKMTLDILNKAANVTTAQVIQATLAQIGIAVDIKLHEAGTFWTLGDSSKGDRYKSIQLILNRYSMAPDPSYAAAWFVSSQKGIWNWERFSNAEFDRLEIAAKTEVDKGKRDQMYQKMQDIMENSGAYRFLTHEATPVIYSNDIKPAFRPDGLPLFRNFSQS